MTSGERTAREPARPAAVLVSAGLVGAGLGGLALVRGREVLDALGPSAAGNLPPLALLAAALGSLAFAPLVARSRRPLAAAGAFALAAALLSLVVPLGVDALRGSTGAVATVGLWVAVGPSAFALGGALCALLAACRGEAADDREDRALGALGGAVLGGGLGHWIAGFGLAPEAGLAGAANVATAVLLAGGAVALALGRAGGPIAPAPAPASPPSGARRAGALLLVGAAAQLWLRLGAREFALAAGPVAPTAWAFGAAFCFLAGAGLWLAARTRGPAPRCFAVLESVLLGAALLASIPWLGTVFGELAELRASPGQGAVLLGLGALFAAAPALGLGTLFGALARGGLRRAFPSAALGAVGAALALELAALPGRQVVLRVALGLIPVAAVLAPVRAPARQAERRTVAAAAAAAALVLVLVLGIGAGPRSNRLLGRESPGAELLLAKEGPHEDRAVALPAGAPDAERPPALWIDGRPLNGPGALGLLAPLLHPGTRSVLVDGLGTGSVVRALGRLGVERIAVAEDGAAAVEAAELFGELPEFELLGVDLRAELARTGPADAGAARYDAILVDATEPWRRGSTARTSRDFFEAAGARLAPFGLLLVELPADLWVQHLSSVIATGIGVFPDALLLDASPPGETTRLVLALGARGVLPQRAELETTQTLLDQDPTTTAALGTTDLRTALLERIWLDRAQLLSVTARFADPDPLRDGSVPYELRSFPPPTADYSEALRRASVALLLTATDLEFRRKLFTDWRCSTDQLDALKTWKTRYLKAGDIERGLALVRLGLAYDPDDPELMADALLFAEVQPELFQREGERLLRRSPTEFYRLGVSLAQAGRMTDAIAVLERLVEAHPGSTLALAALAEAHDLAGNNARAEELRDTLRDLDPVREALGAR